MALMPLNQSPAGICVCVGGAPDLLRSLSGEQMDRDTIFFVLFGLIGE